MRASFSTLRLRFCWTVTGTGPGSNPGVISGSCLLNVEIDLVRSAVRGSAGTVDQDPIQVVTGRRERDRREPAARYAGRHVIVLTRQLAGRAAGPQCGIPRCHGGGRVFGVPGPDEERH